MTLRDMPDHELFAHYEEATREDVRNVARRYTRDAIQVLVRLMTGTKTPPSVKRQAATDILNQGWGRPDQRGDGGDAKSAGITINILKLSTGTVESVIAGDSESMEILDAVAVAKSLQAGKVKKDA